MKILNFSPTSRFINEPIFNELIETPRKRLPKWKEA